MKTQYFTACSLDGFIATDDHSLEWLFQLGDIAETGYPDFIREVGVLAMGSSTYECMLRHFEKQGQDAASCWPYTQPCWVFSSRKLRAIRGVELYLVRGDVRPVYDEMQSNPQGTPMCGIQTIGYDATKKKYVGTWVDSMMNYLWLYEGNVDETGNKLTHETGIRCLVL